jgi:CO/xanthine dehydrogenase Mo-binding subunit
MSNYKVIGQSARRIDAPAKVTGQAVYAGDMHRAGMLYAKILFSDRPHARLVRVDTSRALALPGVEAIVTSQDTPNQLYGLFLWDRLIFAKDKVRHVGEPIAAVAATSLRLALQALALIEVEYEDLPAVFTLEEAMAADAPLIHPDLGSYQGVFAFNKYGNVCLDSRIGRGDVTQGFAEADHVFEQTYKTAPMHQTPLEPHAYFSEIGPDGRVVVYSGVSQPHICHAGLARSLGLRMSEITLAPACFGGGFGVKNWTHFEPICALLTQATRRPVRLVMTREEEFTTSHARPPFQIHIRTGVKQDGTLVAREVDIQVDTGGYADNALGMAAVASSLAQGPYSIPHCTARARAVYTNNPDWGCMRGYGALEMAYAVEAQLDLIARELHLDPADLRLKNLCQEGEPTISGQAVTSVSIRATMEAALEASDYRRKKGHLAPGRGIGIGNMLYAGNIFSASAIVRANPDGSVTALTGVVDIGTGTYTALCQIVAETLEIPFEQVRMTPLDTDSAPYDHGSIDSRTISATGAAVHMAAVDFRAKLIKTAAVIFQCSPDDVAWSEGCAYHPANPAVRLGIPDLLGFSHYVIGGPLIGFGGLMASPPYTPVGEGYFLNPWGNFLFATHVAEVEVDLDTGRTQVVNYTAAQDPGRLINPSGADGQVHGGVLQGIGYSLYEELLLQEGHIMNPNLVDYRLPTVKDITPITARYIEQPDPAGPFGAKGLGETTMIPVPGAIANAVLDATGVHTAETPITPERLYHALKQH